MRLTNRIKQAGATGYIFTLASRNPDSGSAPYLSAPRLHIKTWERALIENSGTSKINDITLHI